MTMQTFDERTAIFWALAHEHAWHFDAKRHTGEPCPFVVHFKGTAIPGFDAEKQRYEAYTFWVCGDERRLVVLPAYPQGLPLHVWEDYVQVRASLVLKQDQPASFLWNELLKALRDAGIDTSTMEPVTDPRLPPR